jgi:PhzF family phenazine biosynthesis protein
VNIHVNIVDTFTSVPYKGNPAAVFIVSDFFSGMEKISKEINFTASAFIKKIKNDTYHIRWFTPTLELKLCGHGTLASAHILLEQDPKKKITFYSLSGPLFATKKDKKIILDFPILTIGEKISKSNFEKALHMTDEISEVFMSGDCAIVVLKKEEFVISLTPDFKEIEKLDASAIIVTSASKKYDFISRFFAPKLGINEDPVCGSAHSRLASYWSACLKKDQLKAYQASHRGGEVGVNVLGERVLLEGEAVTMLEGVWKYI